MILDVCHNPSGVAAVLEKIKAEYPEVKNVNVVFAAGKNKDVQEIIKIFETDEKVASIFPVSKPHSKLLEIVDIVAGSRSTKLNVTAFEAKNNIEETIKFALTQKPDLLLVCGSFFIMSDARLYFNLTSEDEVDASNII